MAINADVRRKHGAASSHKTQDKSSSPADPWEEQEMAAEQLHQGGLVCLCTPTTSFGIGGGMSTTPQQRRRRRSHLLGSPPRKLHSRSQTRTSSMSMSDDDNNDKSDAEDTAASTTQATLHRDDGDDEACLQCGKTIWPGHHAAAGFTSTMEHRRRHFFHAAPSSGSFRRIRRSATLEGPDHAASLLDATPPLRYLSNESRDMQGEGPLRNVNFLTYLSQAVVDGTSSFAAADRHATNAAGGGAGAGGASNYNHHHQHPMEYCVFLEWDRTNNEAAAELASLLWLLAHEMSFEDYGTLESSVFTSVFRLIHSPDNNKVDKLAGLAAVTALLPVPSADNERKIIKLANTLSHALRAANGDYDTMRLCAEALGTLAARTASVDFVEAEITRALEWLQMNRSDRR
jgi:hypothetical protein